jgi:hypothetical protein
MVNQTITIVKHGHLHTLREVGNRNPCNRIDAFGKNHVFEVPQPYYDRRPNMALSAVRKLTKSELKELQNEH